MVSAVAGDQWNEGDVSCSVVRRVAIPDAFYTADGVYQTLLWVLDEFAAFGDVIDRELRQALPELATTASSPPSLMRVSAARRRTGSSVRMLLPRPRPAVRATRRGRPAGEAGGRSRVPLDRPQLGALVADPLAFAGTAPARCGRSSSGWRRSWPRTPRLPATDHPRCSEEDRRDRRHRPSPSALGKGP